LTFTFTLDNDRSEDFIPSIAGNGDYIAIAHDDLDPSSGGGSMRIEYATIGTAPNRQFILNFFDVPHRGFVDSLVSVQLKLFETTGVVELHTLSIESDGAQITQGIENAAENIAFSPPGRNKAIFFTSNEAWRLTPQLGLITYDWSPGDSLADSTSLITDAFPVVSTNYVLTIDNGICVLTDTVFVDVPGVCTLPIEGLELEGFRDGDIARLNWHTESETHADYFLVERSQDDRNYEEIHRVDALGRAGEYLWEDSHPAEGLNFYRITGVDGDGDFYLSNVVAVNFSAEGDDLLQVYPNPGQGIFHFDFALTQPGRVEIRLFDLTGRKLITHTPPRDRTGNFTETLELGELAEGFYLYHVLVNEQVFTGKLQIIR
jgi:hypothetical protein